MKSTRFLFSAICCFVLFASCGDSDADALKERLNRDYTVTKSDKASRNKNTKEEYKNIEFSYNKKYVSDLTELLENSFEKQLDEFEDRELGFFSTIGHTFSWIFQKKQTRVDEMAVKSQKYFNSLDTKQDMQELYDLYQQDVKNLRTRYTNSRYNMLDIEDVQNLDIPKLNIKLDMDAHTRNNLIIDVFADIVGWIIAMIIIWILLFLLGLVFGLEGVHVGCVFEIVAFAATLVIAILISNNNDKKLLDGLREQNTKEITQNYDGILETLNENTTKFYDRQ